MLEIGENKLERDGLVQPKPALSGCTGLSGGAPDSVRCARLVRANWPLSGISPSTYGYNSPDCPVCTGLSGEPTVSRANGRLRDPRGTRGRANGWEGAPDCLVCTGHVRCANGSLAANGRLRQLRKEIGHRTVSGAPRDRRQELPSQIDLSGS